MAQVVDLDKYSTEALRMFPMPLQDHEIEGMTQPEQDQQVRDYAQLAAAWWITWVAPVTDKLFESSRHIQTIH